MAPMTWSVAALMMPVLQECGTIATPLQIGELGDAHALGDTAGAGDVRLDDVDLAARP